MVTVLKKPKRERRAYKRAYRVAHREELRAYAQTYYAANREEWRAYYAAHRKERRAYAKVYYAAHREDFLVYNEARRKRRRQKIHAWKRKRGCIDCGTHEGVLHFHHIDPSTKRNNVSYMATMSSRNLKAEIRKCVILCAPCHIKRHGNGKRHAHKHHDARGRS